MLNGRMALRMATQKGQITMGCKGKTMRATGSGNIHKTSYRYLAESVCQRRQIFSMQEFTALPDISTKNDGMWRRTPARHILLRIANTLYIFKLGDYRKQRIRGQFHFEYSMCSRVESPYVIFSLVRTLGVDQTYFTSINICSVMFYARKVKYAFASFALVYMAKTQMGTRATM